VLALVLVACGGGRVPVPQACVDYYNCGAKTGWTDCYAFDDPRNAYGSNGSCWDTPQMADSCTTACAAADDSLKRPESPLTPAAPSASSAYCGWQRPAVTHVFCVESQVRCWSASHGALPEQAAPAPPRGWQWSAELQKKPGAQSSLNTSDMQPASAVPQGVQRPPMQPVPYAQSLSDPQAPPWATIVPHVPPVHARPV
jgi:hypothetical protein